MRAYFFTLNHLSGIQKGIQAGHCLAEIWLRSERILSLRNIMHEWANKHKTMIVLNGGDCTVLLKLSGQLAIHWSDLRLPWGYFHEDASLNNAMTAVGIIVPESIYAETENNFENESHKWLHQEIWSRTLAQ